MNLSEHAEKEKVWEGRSDATGIGEAESQPWPNLRVQWLLLGFIIFVAYYARFRSFGLYEDDWAWAFWISEDGSELLSFNPIQSLIGWGRPTGSFLKQLLPWLGGATGSISGLYMLGWLIHWANAGLLLMGLQRIGGSRLSFVSASLFALYPGDPIKFYLNRSFEGYVAILFFLMALLLYQNRRLWARLLVYPLLLLSFTIYEIVVVGFAALPLLKHRWDRSIVRNILIHCMGIGMVLIPIIMIRFSSRSGRVGEMAEYSSLELLGRSLSAMGIGVTTAAKLLFSRIPAGLQDISWHGGLTGIVVAGSIALVLWSIFPVPERSVLKPDGFQKWIGTRISSVGRLDVRVFATIRLAFLGLALWCTSYAPFVLIRYPPNTEEGRLAGVHAAGSLGSALFVGSLIYLVLLFIDRRGSRKEYRVLALVLATYLGALTIFHVSAQTDFVEAWSDQRKLLADIVRLTPDINNETVVVVEEGFSLSRRHILNLQFWQCGFLYSAVYDTSSSPRAGPICVPHPQNPLAPPITTQGDELLVTGVPWWGQGRLFSSGQIIVLERQGKELVRRKGSWEHDGTTFLLKPPEAIIHFPPSAIFDDVLGVN